MSGGTFNLFPLNLETWATLWLKVVLGFKKKNHPLSSFSGYLFLRTVSKRVNRRTLDLLVALRDITGEPSHLCVLS